MLLFGFELFVVSWHSLPELESPQFAQLAEAISGMPNAPPWFSLTGLIVVWILVGGLLAGCLSMNIGAEEGPWHVKAGKGALYGLRCGALIPPCAVLVVVLFVRFALALAMMIGSPEKWRGHVDAVMNVVPWFMWLPLWALCRLDDLVSFGGPIVRAVLLSIEQIVGGLGDETLESLAKSLSAPFDFPPTKPQKFFPPVDEPRRIASAAERVTKLQAKIARAKADLTKRREQVATEFDEAAKEFDVLTKLVDTDYVLALDEYRELAAQRLELALACSFGFWTTIGLLIAWGEFIRLDLDTNFRKGPTC